MQQPSFLLTRTKFHDFYWSDPDYTGNIQNWNELAAENAFHAVVSAVDEVQEKAKGESTISFLQKRIKPNTRILDLGCGYGRIAKYLLPLMSFDAYVGIDSSVVMLQKFHERTTQQKNEEKTTPVTLLHGDIDRIPLEDRSMDYCFVSAVFLHNPKDVIESSLKEIRRVLKPGGTIFVLASFPNATSLMGVQGNLYLRILQLIGQGKRNGPVRYFSHKDVSRLMQDFHDLEILPIGFSVLPKSIIGFPNPLQKLYRYVIYAPLERLFLSCIPKRYHGHFATHYDVVAKA